MRIISQDGLNDYDYDVSSLEAEKYDDRYVVFIYTKTRRYAKIIAEYSSKEKVIKAMEMCRDKYCEIKSWIDESGFGYTLNSSGNHPKIFQFPRDEEVEV